MFMLGVVVFDLVCFLTVCLYLLLRFNQILIEEKLVVTIWYATTVYEAIIRIYIKRDFGQICRRCNGVRPSINSVIFNPIIFL